MENSVNKDRAILLMEEALSIEEIPMLVQIDEIGAMIENSDFDKETKDRLSELSNRLKNETIEHARSFNELIKYMVDSGKNEF